MLFCESSRERYSFLPLSSLQRLLKIFGIPWFVDCSSNLCLYHHMVLSFLSLPSFYKDTSFIGFRVHPAPSWPHLDLITSSKTLFLNKVTFTGMRVRTWAHPSGGMIQLITLFQSQKDVFCSVNLRHLVAPQFLCGLTFVTGNVGLTVCPRLCHSQLWPSLGSLGWEDCD